MSKSVHLVVLWLFEVDLSPSVFRNLRNKGIHLCCLLLTESQMRLTSEIADTPLPITNPAHTDAVLTHASVMPLCLQGLHQKQGPVSSRTKDAGDLRPVPLVSRRPPSNHGPKGKTHRSRPVSGCGSAWWRGEDDHSPWKVLPLLFSSHIRDDYICSWSEKSDFHSKHCIMRTGLHKHQLHFDRIKQIIFVFKSPDLQVCYLLLLHVCHSAQIDYHQFT